MRSRLAESFEMRKITVAPGAVRPYIEAEWRDSLVVVAGGEIELLGRAGARQRFRQGAILWLVGLPVREIHNPGAEPAIVLAVSRRGRAGASDEFRPPSSAKR
ncbi:MAG: hypothetical protein JO206_05190 [Solirubrobacterales bacterium]|nr:hypothetical protein [Solirubrobacterales bacterium]MBV9472343.1 hypothetical protein [Solirubrobacterales bacterium]MBV9837945.1 hypothetical protein [Solirubrobacterales bacterium]